MTDISKIHDEVFSVLFSWSQEQRQTNRRNPYFYMRMVRDKRFKSGFWFPGNEEYLCISFWTGGDAYNKTPNAYLEINIKKGCRVILTSKDSDQKFKFLSLIATSSNAIEREKHYVKKSGRWEKVYSRNYEVYLDVLKEYIETDKGYIDAFIEEKGEDLVLEEFVQPFTFITSVEFETMLTRVRNEKREIEKTKVEQRRAQLQKPRLPFALKGISIENYQGIIKTSVNNLPLDAKWIFITGENGFGKTSLIQSIALALNSNPELEKYIDVKTRITSEVIFNDEEETLTRIRGNLSQSSSIPYEIYTIGYGPARLNVQAETSQNEETKSRNNVSGLFDSTTLLKNLIYELFATNTVDSKSFDALKEIIKEVTKGRISDVRVEKRDVLFRETINQNEEMPWMALSNLASGFRNLINIVGDIFIRFSVSQRHSNYKSFYGMVFIDEIENHLHPIIQKEITSALSTVFPKIQFVATTHSPIPLLGSPNNSVILNVTRTRQKGVEINRLLKLEKQVRQLLPDTILSSAIFKFDYLEKLSDEEFNRLSLESNYEDIEKYQELNQRLRTLNKDIFPDELFNDK